jgi:leucyl-tRNA synthetase
MNTAISALMEFSNAIGDAIGRSEDARDAYRVLLQLLHPFAPHITEEMWGRLGGPQFILTSGWPTADPELMKEDIATVVVQVNGKLRGQVEVPSGASQDEVFAAVEANENVQKWLAGKELVKRVYIPGKLVNLVIR